MRGLKDLPLQVIKAQWLGNEDARCTNTTVGNKNKELRTRGHVVALSPFQTPTANSRLSRFSRLGQDSRQQLREVCFNLSTVGDRLCYLAC